MDKTFGIRTFTRIPTANNRVERGEAPGGLLHSAGAVSCSVASLLMIEADRVPGKGNRAPAQCH
jgi:hypothetical protein